MNEAYLGEIRLLSFVRPPQGWALCDGQLLGVDDHQALFNLLGNQFGGDGGLRFALPDLRSRVPLGVGPGYVQGMRGGVESVQLETSHLPAHAHPLAGTLQTSLNLEEQTPLGNYPAAGGAAQYSPGPADTTMLPAPLSGVSETAGKGHPHENRQPMLGLNYIICLDGALPPKR